MFELLSSPVLLLVFAAAAAAVWIAGIQLSKATDILDRRWALGGAMGGLVLLAIVTNLPELAIVASGAWRGNTDLAVGNILGGIAIQTVVLVVLDKFAGRGGTPLTSHAASPVLVLEAAMVLAILAVVIMGSQLGDSLILARMTPQALMIALLWGSGLWLITKCRASLQPHNEEKKQPADKKGLEAKDSPTSAAARRATWIFAAGAIITLLCGVVLEMAGDVIAARAGMNGKIFGATVLAAATALPEVSTGLMSIKLKDHQLAVSDILGGNAFLPVLFLLATVLSGHAVLPHAQQTDIYLTGLGMLLTCVYLAGLVLGSKRQVAGLGIDSILVLVLYVLGVLGLFGLGN